MSGTKIIIAVLFLIAILFVVGINLGTLHPDDQKVQTPSWVQGLGGALVKSQPLKMSDLSATPASCLGQGNIVVAPGKTCTFAIQQSPFNVRVVTLQLTQGTTAMATLSQETTLSLQKSLTQANSTTSNDWKVYPGKTHGVLSITCLDTGNTGGVPPCLLKLK